MVLLGMSENTANAISEVIYPLEDLRAKIYVIRGVQVMLDSDLAAIYGYETKKLQSSSQKQ